MESAEIKLWGSWRLPRGRTQGFSRRERFNSWPLAPRAVGPFSCSRLAEGRLRFCSREAQGQAAISPDLSKNPCRIISCYTDISNQLCLLPVSASPITQGVSHHVTRTAEQMEMSIFTDFYHVDRVGLSALGSSLPLDYKIPAQFSVLITV